MDNRFKELIKQARDLDHEFLKHFGFRINLSKEFRNTTEDGGHEHRMLYFNPQHVDLRDGAIRYVHSYRMVYVKNENSGLFVDLEQVEQHIIKKVRDVTQLSEDFQ